MESFDEEGPGSDDPGGGHLSAEGDDPPPDGERAGALQGALFGRDQDERRVVRRSGVRREPSTSLSFLVWVWATGSGPGCLNQGVRGDGGGRGHIGAHEGRGSGGGHVFSCFVFFLEEVLRKISSVRVDKVRRW